MRAEAQRSGSPAAGPPVVQAAIDAKPPESASPMSPDPPLSAPPPPPDAAARIQYVGPDTYILLDKQGRPQPMPGMTYEDFMAAWKRLQQPQEPDRNPRFMLESIEIVGRAEGLHAKLQLDATVRLLTDEPVDVPLGLVDAILDGEPKFHEARTSATASPDANEKANVHTTSAGDEYLDYDPQRGGFVARFVRHTNDRRKLSLNFLVPLQRDGTGTTLALAYPRTVSAKLTLDIAERVVEANVTSGSLISQNSIGDRTQLVVAGAMGPFRLSWQTPERGAAEFTSVLNAEGAIRVAIDGRSVRTDARLTVRSHGGSFDRFRVRLPAGARLVQQQSTDADSANPPYRLSIEEDQSSASQPAGAEHQLVVVELREKQRGPVTINLLTEQPIGLADATSTVQLSAFEVLDAVRQYGDIALQVAPDWQARWDLGAFVRQVDPDELDSTLRPANVTAAFQYDRQPWSLGVRMAARKLRVVVTPTYELECSANEARLAVRLVYQVLGARAFDFGVDLNGWELTTDSVESGGLVDMERMQVTDDGILTLPLAQASSRRTEIEFHAKRSLMSTARKVQLPLPKPLADSISPAELTVRAAAGYELVPDIQKSRGVAAQLPAESGDSLASADGTAYHFRVGTPDAVFAAELTPRSREVSHADAASITIDENSARVEQQIVYNVRHEPVRELVFELPQELVPDTSRLNISLLIGTEETDGDGQPRTLIELVPVLDTGFSDDLRRVSRLRVVLPRPRQGEFSLRIEYEFFHQATANEDHWKVPLIRALDGDSASQRATIRSVLPLNVALDPTAEGLSWQPAAATEFARAASAEVVQSYISDHAEMFLPLVSRAVKVDAPSATTVDRIWLQSWMSADTRQDRAAFRFRTAGSQVAIELAPQTPDVLEVLMDGMPARTVSREAGRVVVDVPRASPTGDATTAHEPPAHTLELRYRVPIRFALVTSHALTPPQMIGMTTLSAACWHVVLPGDKHVIRSPVQMAAAQRWQWLGGFWGRTPGKSQAELEEWVGATSQLAPSGAHSQYLYTGLSPVSTIALVSAPRWLIVFAASAVVLMLALAAIYLPVLRKRWVLGAVALAIAGVSLVYPEAALLLAQASLLGVGLAALAMATARLLVHPTPWQVVVPASASPRQPAPRPDSAVVTPVATVGSTAPTVSVRVSGSE